VKLAVIGTFYGRHENTFPLLHRLLVDGTRKPDEAWLMCEGHDDVAAIELALDDLYEMELIDGPIPGVRIISLQTPKVGGRYAVIPYSRKINWALDASQADAFVYLDNNSMPGPDKYAVMAQALEQHPEYGAVYCTQKRTGFNETVFYAEEPVYDAFCVLNYTQVMHRRTDQRWTMDMRWADPDLADGLFWRQLHDKLGPFFPAGGKTIQDWHHIPSPAATLH
jgi:hypothetical protein